MDIRTSRRRALVGAAAAVACAGAADTGTAGTDTTDTGTAGTGTAGTGTAGTGTAGTGTAGAGTASAGTPGAGTPGAGERAARTAHSTPPSRAAARIAELERTSGGRLGVAAIDTGSGRYVQRRGSERFAMCSVFKFLAVAAVLQSVDQGKESLGRWVTYEEKDLLVHAPVLKEHVQQHGMTLGDICAAAVQWSDNAAANLILKSLNGPASVTQFIRSLGDQVTRLDDIEPAMNAVKPGSVRNTSSPESMLGLLSTVLLGKVLADDSRLRLEGWMLDAKVGAARLPAGLPSGWRIAHKTGTWDDETNDVGVIWPPNRAPLVVVAFYWQGTIPQEQREAVLGQVGRIIADGI